jgi:hypothetical protein
MKKISKYDEFINEAKIINCEPNWKNLYRWALRMKETDPKQFAKFKKDMGPEWAKLVAIATKDDKKEEKK